jgi:hypothetical protein
MAKKKKGLSFSLSDITAFVNSVLEPHSFTFDMPDIVTPETLDRHVQSAIDQRFGVEDQEATDISDVLSNLWSISSIKEFVKSFSFELIMPGTHYSGLSNQELLELFQENDRDFAQDTPELRSYAVERMAASLAGKQRDDDAAGELAASAIKDWIVGRIEEQGRDISLKALSPAYRASKVAAGFDPRIGIRKSKWFKTIKSKGYVRIDF